MTSSPDATRPWTAPALDAAAARGADAPGDARAARRWVPDDLVVARAPAARSAADEAYARGFDDGVAAGFARAREDLQPAVEMLACVVSHLADATETFNRDRARNLEGLAVAIARRIVQREIAADPGILRDLIARGLELLPLDIEITVRVHPEDLVALGDAIAGIATPGRTVTLHWTPDPTLERGSFIADSPQRMVDGRSDVALRALYERLGDD